jgi:hypothetical protein
VKSLLAQADAAQKANVKLCSCGWGYRVKGIEYETGGCMDYDQALATSRRMDAMGGPAEWRRRYRQRRRAERWT